MSRLPAAFPTIALVACLVAVLPARAEIYKFVDDDGQVTYTNMPRPGVKPQVVIPDLKPAAQLPTATDSKVKTRPSTRTPTPTYFPKVDTGTQRKRDDMRRQLLVEELRSEERNLAAAKGAFATGSRQPGSDVTKLLDSVRMHEKNIEMLNKELSHIR